MARRFFEDWHVCKRLEHEMRRTVTETDKLLIATRTHKPRRLHLDTDSALEHP
jgi:acyl dehydratase